jgi:hypothetical protein
VTDGVIMPADPELEDADRHRSKYPVFRFQPEDRLRVGEMSAARSGRVST